MARKKRNADQVSLDESGVVAGSIMRGLEEPMASPIEGNGDGVVGTTEVVKAEIAAGTAGTVPYGEVMSESYLVYAWSTLLSRALPQIDGLLPVQRRILQAMNGLNLNHKSRYSKCAGIVGETMKRYHPHGDAAIYGALARMAQDFSLRVPLIDGQGNFGSIDGDGAAAMRYTEARLSEPAERLMDDLHPEILPDFYDRNFDESQVEAGVLPARFPNLLINGAYGIGTGMTCLVLPHNPAEMIDLCIWRLGHEDASVEQMADRINGPDFPGGATVLDDEGLRQSYLTGKGKVTGVAKAHIEPMQGGREKIVITELPWMVNKGDMLKKDIASRHDDRYPELADLNDFSDESIRIEMSLKRGADARAVLQRMHKYGVLRRTYGVEMNCVVDGRPKTLNLADIVDEFLKFRRYVVVKRAEKRIGEIERRLHQLDAYLKVIGATDAVVQIIKKSKDRDAAKPKLKKLLKIDDQQAQWIVSMQLGALTQLDSQKIKQEDKELKAELKHLKKLIRTESMITDVIVEEFGETKDRWKKEGVLERRSSLVEASSGGEGVGVDIAAASVPAEDCLLMISRDGRALCAQGTLRRGASLSLKGEDRLVVIADSRTDRDYLIFTDVGQAYRVRLAELPLEGKRSAGCDLRGVIGMGGSEKVVAAVPVDADRAGSALFVSMNGIVKRTEWSEFVNTHSSGVVAAKPASGDEIIAVLDCPDDADIVLMSDNGKALRFAATGARNMGRNAGGVGGMKLADGEKIVGALVCNAGEDKVTQLLMATDTGWAKRVSVSEIPAKGRNTGGVVIMKVKEGEKYGRPYLAIAAVDGAELYVDGGAGKLKGHPVSKVALVKRAIVPKRWPGEGSLALFIRPAE